MNLNELASKAKEATGSATGFIIKSVKNPDRRFMVGFKSEITGAFLITRLDTKEDFVVKGDVDRYDFVMDMGKLKALKAERAELAERKAEIEARLLELDEECGGLTDVSAAG